MCRNGLGHNRSIALFARPQIQMVCPSSYHTSSIHHWYTVSGGFVCQSSKLFLLEAVRDTLVSYAWCNVVLLNTRVATPQLGKELCTLPVEVSFTHGPTHVLSM